MPHDINRRHAELELQTDETAVDTSNGQGVEETVTTVNARLARIVAFVREQNLLIILITLTIISTIASPVFFTVTNLMNLARQASYTGILSIGMTYVALTGGLDLSVGAVAALEECFWPTCSTTGYRATLSHCRPSSLLQ